MDLNEDKLNEDSMLSKNISKIGISSEHSINSNSYGHGNTSSFGGSSKSNFVVEEDGSKK